MNKSFTKILLIILQTAMITSLVLLAVLPFSCRVTTHGIQILGGNYSCPKIMDYYVVDENTLAMQFSQSVTLKDLVLSPFIEGVSDSLEAGTGFDGGTYSGGENYAGVENYTGGESYAGGGAGLEGEESLFSDYEAFLPPALQSASGLFGKIECSAVYDQADNQNFVYIHFDQNTRVGQKYQLYGIALDKSGNSLSFLLPFMAYNNRLPELLITEIHTNLVTASKSEKEGGIRRLEYVECLALSGGNLAGLALCSGYEGLQNCYELPAVEVSEGEIFLIHPRSKENGCISEEGDDLNLAFSGYCGSYRDLWNTSESKPMGDKNDILVIKNLINGKIVEAVMYSNYSIEKWSDYLKTDFSVEEGFADFYEDASVSSAINSESLTASKVLIRNIESGEWSVGNSSPGSL